jgi:hypothetical protein
LFCTLTMENSANLILQVATVAVIVVATRWLFGVKGAQVPRTRGDTRIYSIKWQWRAVGLASVTFWAIVLIWSWRDRGSRPDATLIVITVAFVLAGLWLASGSVRTNPVGITKSVLWRSHSFPWGDITEIRLHKKQGGAIELRAGSRRLVIDSRFVAFRHLLTEIEDHTQLHPTDVAGGAPLHPTK